MTTDGLAATARSFLFVPGDRPERFSKAWNSAADAIILDLEDAVAPANKDVARDAVRAWLDPERPVWVRCNAADTAWFFEDLQLARQGGLAGFLVPKAEGVPERLRTFVTSTGLRWIPIVETAVGMERAQDLARADGVVRLAFGALDFQVDLGIDGDDDALHYFRSRLVLASRLAGCAPPIDGVTPSIDDEGAVSGDTLRARRFGMTAKLCIHPRQVAWVHEAFQPSVEERAWALRVLETMEASAGAAVSVDGKMVDRPVWLRAQRISQAPMADLRLRA